VESGVDVFDSASVYSTTERGCALTYHNSTVNRSHPLDRRQFRATDDSGKERQPFEIDLRDEKYAADFFPVLRSCQCYCCLHHTRAYLHHLLATREILASTLLMMYNHNYTAQTSTLLYHVVFVCLLFTGTISLTT
jgi:tRNA-guanine family transglycosylase